MNDFDEYTERRQADADYAYEQSQRDRITTLERELSESKEREARLQDRVNYLEAIMPLPKPKSTGGSPYTLGSEDSPRPYEPLQFDPYLQQKGDTNADV